MHAKDSRSFQGLSAFSRVGGVCTYNAYLRGDSFANANIRNPFHKKNYGTDRDTKRENNPMLCKEIIILITCPCFAEGPELNFATILTTS